MPGSVAIARVCGAVRGRYEVVDSMKEEGEREGEDEVG